MKHAIPYLIFLFIFLQSSCKEDNTSSIEEIYVETTFQLKGELPDILLSSSAPNNEKRDLYGIDVLYADMDETPYAYGLFDDLSLAKVKLQKGKKYLFRVMVVPNGKELCYDHLYGDYIDIFRRLVENLGISAGEACPLNNEFYYHKEVHFWKFNNPIISYYYKIYTGYLSDYLAETDNTVDIDMKGMFGNIKLEAKNLLHGQLEFQFLTDFEIPISRSETDYNEPLIYTLTPNKMDTNFIYSLRFWGNANREMPDDYSFTSNYMVRWIDDNGKSTDLGVYPVKVQRGQETIIKLDLSELLKK